jgi:hypothetical protein
LALPEKSNVIGRLQGVMTMTSTGFAQHIGAYPCTDAAVTGGKPREPQVDIELPVLRIPTQLLGRNAALMCL